MHGNPAYTLREHLQTGFKNQTVADEFSFNERMASVRVSVEWVFRLVFGNTTFKLLFNPNTRRGTTRHCYHSWRNKVNGLIEIAEKCTNSGVEKVFISSLITCSRVNESRIDEINRLLKERCEALDVTFIENDNIKNSSLWKDGIHLTDDGKTMLAKNYLYYFNHFLYHNMYFQSWV